MRADLRSSLLVIDFVFDLDFVSGFGLSFIFEVLPKTEGYLCCFTPVSLFLDSSLFTF